MEVGITIIAFSIFVLIGGIYLLRKGDYLLDHGRIVKATILKNNYKATEDGGMYFPVVRFITDKEERITKELDIGYVPAKKEGTQIEVIYDPNDPSDVKTNSIFQLEILPRLLTVIGTLGVVIGAFVLWYILRRIGD